MMGILDELKTFLKSILSGIILFLCVSIVFFVLPLDNSFAVQAFKRIEADLLPSGVHLIVTNPLSGFIAEMEIALLLAFVVLFPFFLYKIIKYLSPALFKHEKILLLKSLLPATLLFFLGCIFSYLYVIPATFKVLYPFASNIGATPFFSLEEFTSSVFTLLIITGVMFLLPIFMVLLSYLRIVKPEFWLKKLRHALFVFLIFTAIITPDGTGITMAILMIPLTGLYLLGCLLTTRWRDRKIIKA